MFRDLISFDTIILLVLLQTMSTGARMVLTLVLVSMVICSSLANDLQNNRCKWNSKWPTCGTCCQNARLTCITYCVGCKASKFKDPCYIDKSNKIYMIYFYSAYCHLKCGLPRQKKARQIDVREF